MAVICLIYFSKTTFAKLLTKLELGRVEEEGVGAHKVWDLFVHRGFFGGKKLGGSFKIFEKIIILFFNFYLIKSKIYNFFLNFLKRFLN